MQGTKFTRGQQGVQEKNGGGRIIEDSVGRENLFNG